MSFIYEQLIFLGMGAFTSFFARLFKVYPISIKKEIAGVVIGLGMVWLTHQFCDGFYSVSFGEQVRFALLGYLPGRIIFRKKRKKDE